MSTGIIGLKFGKNYIKNLNKLKKPIVTLCSKTKDSYLKLEEKPESAHEWVSDPYHLLNNPEIKNVIIASPPNTHFDFCKTALLNNKNIICEKPFVFTYKEAEYLFNIYKEKKLTFYTTYQHLFNPEINRIKEFIQEEKQNFEIECCFYNNGPYRDYSGCWDYGPHKVSLILYLFENLEISNLQHNRTKNGLTECLFTFGQSKAKALFGNLAEERRQKMELKNTNGEVLFSIEDFNKFNTLKIMLESFFDSVENCIHKNNFDISLKTTKILELISNEGSHPHRL
jgi:predicted dehydrogenase